MAIEEIREAVCNNDIDRLISIARSVDRDELKEAIEAYEAFYNHETIVAREIQNILSLAKIRRVKNKIPSTGSYTYRLG